MSQPAKVNPMSQAAPPDLTVSYDGSQRTFAAGHDVVIGRDLRADMRITHPLISRAHLLLRFDQGRWLAIDNGSLNGTFVNGRRVPVIDIYDGQSINIGNPDGPRLTFDFARHSGTAGRPPMTASMRVAQPSAAARPVATHAPPAPHQPSGARPPQGPPMRPHPGAPPHAASAPPMRPPAGGQRPPTYSPGGPPPAAPRHMPAAPGAPATQMAPAAAKPTGETNLATKMMQALRPGSAAPNKPAGSLTIGRANDNDVVIQDVLASRHHAFLVETAIGMEIRDAHSINGTFVNGVRVGSAVLSEGDVVTIGNVDLVYSDGTLIRRTEAATRSGGLEVNKVHFRDRRQGAAQQHLADLPAGHADRHHRRVRRGQDHAVAVDRRIHPAQLRVGHLRRPRHPRRVRHHA